MHAFDVRLDVPLAVARVLAERTGETAIGVADAQMSQQAVLGGEHLGAVLAVKR